MSSKSITNYHFAVAFVLSSLLDMSEPTPIDLSFLESPMASPRPSPRYQTAPMTFAATPEPTECLPYETTCMFTPVAGTLLQPVTQPPSPLYGETRKDLCATCLQVVGRNLNTQRDFWISEYGPDVESEASDNETIIDMDDEESVQTLIDLEESVLNNA